MYLPLECGLLAFSSLFAVVNPIAAAPVFVALTKGAEARGRRSISAAEVRVQARGRYRLVRDLTNSRLTARPTATLWSCRLMNAVSGQKGASVIPCRRLDCSNHQPRDGRS